MNEPTTNIRKGRDGWEAKTEMPITGLTITEGDKVKQGYLTIRTGKTSRGIETGATVAFRDGMFMTHRLYEDFNVRFAARASRCTEKAIREIHADALAKLDTIMGAALAHYGMAEAA